MRVALLGLLVLASWQRPPLEARFIGNMAFAISDGATTLMTDFPYQSGYSVYMDYPPGDIHSATPRTLSLITHRHLDHWAPTLFTGTTWSVAGPDDVTANVPAQRVVRLGDTTTFGPLQIERQLTPHAGIGHYSYVVTWAGRRLYFTGDTESSEALLATRRLDVAFVSPWIFQSLVRKGAMPDARRIVIYHHRAGEQIPECREGCLVPAQGDVLRID